MNRLVIALCIIFYLGSTDKLQGDEANENAFKIRAASDFSLRSLDGKRFTLSENAGKGPLLINFWASWCSPCLAEMRELEKIETRFRKSGLKVVSISIDDPKTAATVENLVHSRKIPFTVLMDVNKNVSRSWYVSNVPYLFLLDSRNNIVYEHAGYKKGDEKMLEQIIDKLIDTSPLTDKK